MARRQCYTIFFSLFRFRWRLYYKVCNEIWNVYINLTSVSNSKLPQPTSPKRNFILGECGRSDKAHPVRLIGWLRTSATHEKKNNGAMALCTETFLVVHSAGQYSQYVQVIAKLSAHYVSTCHLSVTQTRHSSSSWRAALLTVLLCTKHDFWSIIQYVSLSFYSESDHVWLKDPQHLLDNWMTL